MSRLTFTLTAYRHPPFTSPWKTANKRYAEQGQRYGGTAHTNSSGKTSSGGGTWGAFTGWLSGAKDTFVNYGSAIVSQPDIWKGGAETVASMLLTGLGEDVTYLGVGMCLSGFGCLVGAPVAAGGVSMIGAGATGVADGIGRISDGLGKALNEARLESSGSHSVRPHTVGGPRVRPGKDIAVDDEGFVNPPTAEELKSLDVQGLSTFDTEQNAGRVGLKGQLRAPKGPLPDGLGIISDGRQVGGPRAVGHHTIYPTERMTFDSYQDLIKGMQWENVGVKIGK
ncbi:hypothetical protein NX794_23080 [Streptomyces sp. LP11]|uniref:Uncharacterized protein n=1 Tax=Streptomyces pyxinicus TaxID=2970331 RepID=A0ABT2B6C7_9ACTN|nr:hypothetical protein [Streptomyces sp. LP11]MCS0604073.1 hypothetical protein [Streptomyces sp. LP11]